MKNIITPLLIFMSVQFSVGQKKVYLDSLNHYVSESEFEKLSEPIKDYIIVEGNVVNGEKVISHRIPDSKTLRMIYSEIAKYNNAVKSKTGKPFPETEMHAMDGTTFNIKSFTNKIVVMNFWFVGCAPCVREIPRLNNLVKEFSANTNVVFVAPSFSTKQQVEEFISKTEFNYKLTYDDQYLLQKELGLVSYPTHFIVDKKGVISYVETTELNETAIQSIRAKINELLTK